MVDLAPNLLASRADVVDLLSDDASENWDVERLVLVLESTEEVKDQADQRNEPEDEEVEKNQKVYEWDPEKEHGKHEKTDNKSLCSVLSGELVLDEHLSYKKADCSTNQSPREVRKDGCKDLKKFVISVSHCFVMCVLCSVE